MRLRDDILQEYVPRRAAVAVSNVATPLRRVLAPVLPTLDAIDAAAPATGLAGVLLRAHDHLLAMLERLVLQEHPEAVVRPVQQGAHRLRAKACLLYTSPSPRDPH